MTDIYPALVEQIFHIAERKWETDIHHHRETNDFWRSFEISEWILHPQTLRKATCRLKPLSPDNADYG